MLEADLALLTVQVQVMAPAAPKLGAKVAVVAEVPFPTDGLTKTPVVALHVPFVGRVTLVQSAVESPS